MNFLITGGASGLGYAITNAIAASFPGSQIYFTFHSSAANAETLEAVSKNLHGIKCNFKEANEVESLCQFIQSSEIDVLVNNAFTKLTKQHFHKTGTSDISESFNSDILSTIEITRSFLLKARERKSGKIITILTSGLVGTPPIGWSVYLAGKAYLLAMHKSWATENKAFNITSNCISPDFMATALHKDMDERMIENIVEKHPLKKLLTVEDVAQVVLFLCNSSAQLNGQNIFLNSATNF
jgi:3-oxoacyl-[acyl-carrier protein] reductase